MSFLDKIFGGGALKVDTSAYDRQIKEANKRAAEAKKAAEEAAKKAEEDEKRAKEEQARLQNEIAGNNRDKRASASNRFSLLLFEDDGTLGS